MAYITVDTGEGYIQVWQDDPVPARSDPELPQPSPPQRVESPAPPPTVPVVPGTLNAAGQPQFVQGSLEFIRAEQLAREASREDIRRAAIANGFPPDAAIPTMSYDGKVFITLADGKNIDITTYFEGNPKPPVAIDTSVPTYGTSTVNTPFRQVTVTALPEVARTVNTSEGAIVVDANSESARFIQWQGSQPGLDGRPLRETWARQGISDPYADPKLVAQAQTQINRADARTALFNQNGVTPPGSQIAPWNDPKWPEYQGSNREAYATASVALNDVNAKNQLKAQNGWDEATFQSWALRSTNPEEWGRQAAASDAANGIVAGPTAGSTTGLSANRATVVTTTGGVNRQGFATSTTALTSTNTVGFKNGSPGETTTLGNLSLAERQKIQTIFDRDPAIKQLLEEAYGIDPDLEKKIPITANRIEQLEAEAKRIGFTNLAQNFLKEAQNLVGFGEATWFTGQNPGTTKWANYQKLQLSYSPVLPQAEWEKFITSRYSELGVDINLMYRDPVSNRGVSVKINPKSGQVEGLQYWNSDGIQLKTSVFAAADLYREAEVFGIDLTGISILNNKLAQQNINFLPGQLYGNGSDAGINFENISNYSELDEMATDAWLKDQIALAQQQWTIASSAGQTIPQQVRDAQLLVIQQQHEMAKRTLAIRNGTTPGELSFNKQTIIAVTADETGAITRSYSNVAQAGAVDAATANLFSVGPAAGPGDAGTAAAQFVAGGVAVAAAVDAGLANLPVPVLPDIAGIATGFAAGFTDSLPTLPSITGALQLTAAQVAGLAQAAEDTAAGLLADIKRLPAAIPESLSPYITAAIRDASAAAGLTAINDLLVRQNATIQKAKEQATLETRNNTAAAATDWRVRLQLGPGAEYLYKDREPGILGPLLATNGIIFPYTPSIETAYTANYDKYDLTHSNYRGYFYKNSAVNDINIRGTFTAQDTFEADYLLAVIHFFRSITKMFYGQGDLRGSPPPLVYLSGFGDYQYNKHPCLVSNFSYSLPTDVDYIRAGAPNNYGNLFSQRAKSGGFSTNPIGAVLSRLQGINIPLGAEPSSPTPGPINQNVDNLTGATYVPTKIEINVTLLPTNTRAQVSQQFSLKKYADGSLIKGGYW